jgi:16S rRNA (guanine966-N2)-methyltransferase
LRSDAVKRARGHGPGKVRILGGRLRGSVLEVGDAQGLRPTPARVRETLFNWLQPVLEGARCLDLFAGTGALGVEALSRGAAGVVFVERDAAAARLLQNNLARLKQGERGRVYPVDALSYLEGTPQAFDIVFLDPPFAAGLWTPAAQRLETGGWLAANALIHVESPADQAPNVPENWRLHRERDAGEVRYALYRRLGDDGIN